MTGILIRVFNRIDDLNVCVDVIKKYWIRDRYYIIIVGNGKAHGFPIPEEVRAKVDKFIELDQNVGHRQGNSQLLLEGTPHIPDTCHYTVLLEADTWIFTDDVVKKYTHLLESRSSVWASAEWIEKYWSLGLDFAIANTSYIQNNTDIFHFTTHAEPWVCNYLLEHQQRFLYITENMPVHSPKSMRFLANAYGGRFRCFPKAKMVTHHIEDLENGIETKKLIANMCLGRREFPVGDLDVIIRGHYTIRLIMTMAKVFPRSRWFRKKKKRVF